MLHTPSRRSWNNGDTVIRAMRTLADALAGIAVESFHHPRLTTGDGEAAGRSQNYSHCRLLGEVSMLKLLW